MARKQVARDVLRPRVVRQLPHRLDKPAERGSTFAFFAYALHLRTFARTQPHVIPGTAQPPYQPPTIRRLW